MTRLPLVAVLTAGLVQVSGAANVALQSNGGVASQSSLDYGGPAGRANDGNTSGNWSDASVSHTGYEFQAWWQVVFDQQFVISSIEIFNRTDCCQTRINPFSVFLYTNASDSDPVWSATGLTMDLDNQESLAIPNVLAERLRVRLDGTEYLHLAEVQAFEASGVPEPGTVVLTVSALGALVLRRRFATTR